MMDTVLVLGGAGFIGSHITRELLEHGHQVIVYDQFRPHDRSEVRFILRDYWDNVVCVPGDITDLARIMEVIQEFHINKIVHGAAVNDVSTLRERPYYSLTTNIQGTVNVFEAARISNVDRVVYLSSISVYAPKQYEPIDESHPILHPGAGPSLLNYSVAKAAGELVGLHYWADHHVSVVALRLSGVYGFGMKYPMYIKPMVENAARGVPTHFQFGGTASRDFVHVRDVACGVRLALECEEEVLTSRIYNIACGGPLHTVYDIRDILLRKLPEAVIDIGPELDEYEANIQKVRGTLSIELAKKDLKYAPRYTLEGGIDQYIGELTRYDSSTDH